MNHNLIEWVNFLGTDEYQYFGIKQYGSRLSPSIKDYLTAEEFLKTYAAWANDTVVKVWHNNWDNAGKFFHLIEVEC